MTVTERKAVMTMTMTMTRTTTTTTSTSSVFGFLLGLLYIVVVGFSTLVPVSAESSTGRVTSFDLQHQLHYFDRSYDSIIVNDTTTTKTTTTTSSSKKSPVFIRQKQQQQHVPPNCTTSTMRKHHRLECYLWNSLIINIPDQSFKKDFFTITIHDMTCTQFFIHNIQSSYNASDADDSTAKLSLSISQIETSCTGKYHLSPGGISGNVQAHVMESTAPTTAMDIIFGLQSKLSTNTQQLRHDDDVRTKQPYKCHTELCTTYLKCNDIQFSGSISAKLIQTFSKIISKYITDALQQYICPTVVAKIDPYCTNFLQHQFRHFIDRYLPKSHDGIIIPTASSSSSSSSLINVHEDDKNKNNTTVTTNVSDYPIIHWILSVLNQQLSLHLQDGWIPLPPTDDSATAMTAVRSSTLSSPSPSSSSSHRPLHDRRHQRELPLDCQDMFRGFSGWFKSIFGIQPRITLPTYFQNITFDVPLGSSSSIGMDLNISYISIQGLDLLDQLQILQPISSDKNKRNKPTNNNTAANNNTVRVLQSNVTSSKGFYMTTPVTMTMTIPNKEPLKETIQVLINITNIEVTLNTILQVADWESTTLLQVVNAIQDFVDSIRSTKKHQPNWKSISCLLQTIRTSKIENWVTKILIDSIQISREHYYLMDPDGDDSSSSLEADLDATINTVLRLLLDEYTELWSLLVQGLIGGPLQTKVNNFIRTWLDQHTSMRGDDGNGNGESVVGLCPSPWPINNGSSSTVHPPKWVNFTKFELLYKLNRFLGHAGRKQTINHFLRCTGEALELWTNDNQFVRNIASHPVTSKDPVAHQASHASRRFLPRYPLNGIAGLWEDRHLGSIFNQEVIRLSNVVTRHWDSLNRLQIMKPSSDTKLSSSLIFGNGDNNSSHIAVLPSKKTVNDAPQILFVVDLEGPRLSGQVNLTAFASVEIRVEVQVDYDLNRLENLTISHFLEHGDCGLLPALDIRILPDTTSFDTGKYIGLNLTAEINGRKISLSTLSVPHVQEISSEILNLSSEWVRSIINHGIAELMIISQNRCPGVLYTSPEINGNDHSKSSSSWGLWAVLIVIILAQGGVFLVAQLMQSQTTDDYQMMQPEELTSGESEFEEPSPMSPLLSSFQELIRPFSFGTPSKPFPDRDGIHDTPSASSLDRAILSDIIYEQMHDDDEEEPQVILEEQLFQAMESEELPKSLFSSPGIPRLAPYLVPAMIVATIVLLITSNVSTGATVDLSIRVNERFLSVPNLFEFSLGNTARDLYHAGIYALLILVVCFSGIWPYVKVCLTPYCLLIPFMASVMFAGPNIVLLSNFSSFGCFMTG